MKNLYLFAAHVRAALRALFFSADPVPWLFLLLAQSTGYAGNQTIADTLPKPDAIFVTVMKDIQGKDTSLSTDYWKAINKLCRLDPFPKSLCVIPAKVKMLKKLIRQTFTLNGDVLFPDEMKRRNLWDLRELTSGNFKVLPSPLGPEQTLKSIIEIFVLRNEILRNLARVQLDIKKMNAFPTENMLLTIPFIRATLYSASPLGAALTVFNSMNCSIKEKLCDLLKSRQGGVIKVLIESSSQKISNLHQRLVLASNDEATDQSRRLKLVLAIAEKIQNDKTVLTKDELTKDFFELVDSGQGVYADEAYQNVARDLIILAEANLVNKMAVNFSVYSEELTNKEKQRVKNQLLPLVKQSLEDIELGFSTLGLKKEMED